MAVFLYDNIAQPDQTVMVNNFDPGTPDQLVIDSASAASMSLVQLGADLFIRTVDANLVQSPGINLAAVHLSELSVNNFIFGDSSFLYIDNNDSSGGGSSIFLTGGDDQVLGQAGNDTINGLGGNDLILLGSHDMGSYGFDVINGGYSTNGLLSGQTDTGIDTLAFAFNGQDRGANVNLATGAVTGGAASSGATILFNSIENVIGTGYEDTIVGSSAANLLRGEGSSDQISGGAGNDTLEGYSENDTLDGGDGIDTAIYSRTLGETGIDLNLALGTCSNDGWGGGEGIPLPPGVDTLISIENVIGSSDNDTIVGSADANRLEGAGGDDILDGGGGNDTLIGGAGDDSYACDAAGDVVTELAGQGNDLVQSSVTWTLLAYLERLTLTGADHINGTGNAQGNILTGNAGNNVLNGGAGADTMSGGAGNDTYVRNTAGDVVTEAAGQGNDLVQSLVTYTLGANLERLTLTGTGNINGTGNGASNILTGNTGNNVLVGSGGADTLNGLGGDDTLNGGAGNDTMAGGGNNDTYICDATGDVATEAVGQGNDLVNASATYTLGANLERLTLTGAGNINGTGNAGNNVLTGNAGNNVLSGAGGADTLRGFGGGDTLIWDAADTQVDGGAGNDILRVNGANQTLNLLTVANNKILNVEIINLTGTGNNRLELSLQDVLDLSTTTNTLRVDGNAGDVVDRNTGWTQGANQVIGANTYFSYTQGAAMLLVDTDITVTT